MYNGTGIVRAPCGHHELPVRYPQSVFSDKQTSSLCIITGHEQHDLGEDAVNAFEELQMNYLHLQLRLFRLKKQ